LPLVAGSSSLAPSWSMRPRDRSRRVRGAVRVPVPGNVPARVGAPVCVPPGRQTTRAERRAAPCRVGSSDGPQRATSRTGADVTVFDRAPGSPYAGIMSEFFGGSRSHVRFFFSLHLAASYALVACSSKRPRPRDGKTRAGPGPTQAEGWPRSGNVDATGSDASTADNERKPIRSSATPASSDSSVAVPASRPQRRRHDRCDTSVRRSTSQKRIRTPPTLTSRTRARDAGEHALSMAGSVSGYGIVYSANENDTTATICIDQRPRELLVRRPSAS